MATSPLPILTPRDFAMLEIVLLGHANGTDRLVAAIRRKQERCRIYYNDNLPEDVVTIGSRVRFTINGRPQQERRLVEPQHYVPGQDCQSVASLRGIAMLGQRAGSRVAVDLGIRVETLDILDVLYQPQAAAKTPRRPERPAPSPWTSEPEFDPDPGPAAA